LLNRPAIALLLTGVVVCASASRADAPAAASPVPMPAAERPVLHVVLIALRADAPPGAAQELIDDSKRLLARIPGVEDVRAGRKAADDRDVHVKDYDVALAVRLSRREDLAVYAGDVRHLELLAKHRARFASLRVVDFFGE
jgi:hypothetical protein